MLLPATKDPPSSASLNLAAASHQGALSPPLSLKHPTIGNAAPLQLMDGSSNASNSAPPLPFFYPLLGGSLLNHPLFLQCKRLHFYV
jgi:hypothetical protein